MYFYDLHFRRILCEMNVVSEAIAQGCSVILHHCF